MDNILPRDWKRHYEFWDNENSFKELDDKLNFIVSTIDKRKNHRAWEEANDDIRYARMRWNRTRKGLEESMNVTGKENFKVKDFDLEYTGGGITVAYGVYTNGLGFAIGSDLLFLYDEDARNQFEDDDDVEWQETHSLFDDYGMGLTEKTNLFQTTLKQVFDEEVARHKNVEPWKVMDYSDVFRENNDILNVSVGESVRKNMGRKLKENQFNDYDFEEVEYKEDTPKCRTISRFLSRIDVYDLGYQLVREVDGIVEVEFPDVELTDDDIEKIKRNAIDILGINVEVEKDGDFCTLYFDFAKKESLKNMGRKLKESEIKRYSDVVPYEKRRYWYWTKHGLGPGTLPKGVNVLDVKEGQNQKGTWGVFVLLDAILNTSELRDYDIIELAPEEERKPVRANIWNADGSVTTGEIRESKQINEGPGAGYTISGTLDSFTINSMKVNVDGETDNAIYYSIDCDIDGVLSEVRSESYYYGGVIDETPIKITSLMVSAYKDYDIGEPTEEDVDNLLQDFNFEIVYGGGWSHSTFKNDLEIDANHMNYGYSDFDLDNITFEFTDSEAVDAIDKYVNHENYTTEYSVLDDEDYEVEFFDDKEEAIEYAQENDLAKVVETHWYWEYLGNGEYNNTDDFEDNDVVWEVE